MNITISENYDLPDCDLMQSGKNLSGLKVWEPEQVLVILGKGSDPQDELREDNILRDKIPVIKRSTGGCAVIVAPAMFVASFVIPNDPAQKNNEYFDLFNNTLLTAFQKIGVQNLATAGISDITLNGLKTVGSAIYRNKDQVFYHAVINIAGDIDLMEKYLKIPTRQPDYRKNRTHRDFVTSFKTQGYQIEREDFERALKSEWLWHFK